MAGLSFQQKPEPSTASGRAFAAPGPDRRRRRPAPDTSRPAGQRAAPGTYASAVSQNRSTIPARNARPASPVAPAGSVPVLLQLSVDAISAW